MRYLPVCVYWICLLKSTKNIEIEIHMKLSEWNKKEKILCKAGYNRNIILK
jgi:hypothetical protein